MIRNLFLDADDTLFDFHKSERQALLSTFKLLEIEPNEESLALYSEINRLNWKMLERKEITRSELRVKRYAMFLEQIGSSVSPERAADIYEVELAKGHFFIEGAEELVASLSQSYKLYITSNGFVSTQKGRLASSGIGKYLSGVFISQELGADKPDARYFDACFAQIPNCKKEETLILGDSLTSDILGGKNAGITTVWFNPKGEAGREDIQPDYEIRHLSELPALLQRL